MIRDLNSILEKQRTITRWRLFVLTILISLPLVLRGLFNIFWVVLDLRHTLIITSIRENNFSFPTYMLIYYTLGDLLPMGALIFSVKITIIHFNQDTFRNDLSISSETLDKDGSNLSPARESWVTYKSITTSRDGQSNMIRFSSKTDH